MVPKMILLAFVLAAPCASAADVTMPVQCSRDDAAAVACEFADTVAKDGTHTMEIRHGGQRTRFVGQRQGPWWSGRLDGKDAMGYEIDRGHMVISTRDLQSTFEWWNRPTGPAQATDTPAAAAPTDGAPAKD